MSSHAYKKHVVETIVEKNWEKRIWSCVKSFFVMCKLLSFLVSFDTSFTYIIIRVHVVYVQIKWLAGNEGRNVFTINFDILYWMLYEYEDLQL